MMGTVLQVDANLGEITQNKLKRWLHLMAVAASFPPMLEEAGQKDTNCPPVIDTLNVCGFIGQNPNGVSVRVGNLFQLIATN